MPSPLPAQAPHPSGTAAPALRAPALARLRVLGAAGTLALLSACASHAPVQLSETQEAAQYEAHARTDYSPPGPAEDPWGPYITEAAARFDVPDRWIREVMRVESGGRLYHNDTLVTSPVGAMGLMQVMPATFDEMRGQFEGIGNDPYDPHNSILAGTAYIRQMYDVYGSPGFLAAYNAGPGNLDAYLTRGRRLPAETRRYVAMIAPYIRD
ncbi:MAG: lytic transglycosylase domain-containing protein, partial [Janthinobacterium lividum]